ncbi:hypothetical protein KIH27_02135 [Mycobacterium sp. M1]|uniref:Uncharacterized protein n=1 Tax=Mycolicibacter acidiphilus TaxID=2835306 RepID=A0ABS5RHF7_9MYCO|nr:hypothetical protein [Mycolicibacter acidiphilus]MBS9532384.1 hypothetical protein [Mycolicibacter acidiphilus]
MSRVLSGTAAALAGVLTAVGVSAGVEHVIDHHRQPTSQAAVTGNWPTVGLRDVTPPGPDPYNLIGNHWPKISEGAVTVVSNTARGWTVILPDQPSYADPVVVPTAGRVAADFVQIAGPTMLRQLRVDPNAILHTGIDANAVSYLLELEAHDIAGAKLEMAGLAEAGTAEADALPAGPQREAAISKRRADIAAQATELEAKLVKIGKLLSTPIEGTEPQMSGVAVFRVPQPDGKYAPVNAHGMLVKEHHIVGDHPIVAMPTAMPPVQKTGNTPEE